MWKKGAALSSRDSVGDHWRAVDVNHRLLRTLLKGQSPVDLVGRMDVALIKIVGAVTTSVMNAFCAELIPELGLAGPPVSPMG